MSDMPQGSVAEPTEDELVLTRLFDAPRELVFQTWMRPEHLMRWWAPKECTVRDCTVDPRPGGAFHYCMSFNGGRDIWGLGIYREIEAPEKIAYVDSFADENGNPVSPTYYGMSEGHPTETLVTVTFAEEDGKTRLTLRYAIPVSVEERAGAEQGWSEMLDRLDSLLPSLRQEA